MLDQEWVELMLKAKKLGLTPQEIRDFFKKNIGLKKELSTR